MSRYVCFGEGEKDGILVIEVQSKLQKKPGGSMSLLTKEQSESIIKVLEERGATKPCPRCGGTSFSLADGYFAQSVQATQTGIVLGGQILPSVTVICNKCGYMSQHALGVLGLMQLQKNQEKEEKVGKE